MCFAGLCEMHGVLMTFNEPLCTCQQAYQIWHKSAFHKRSSFAWELCLSQFNFWPFLKYCSIFWCSKQAHPFIRCFVISISQSTNICRFIFQSERQVRLTVHENSRLNHDPACWSSANMQNKNEEIGKITKWKSLQHYTVFFVHSVYLLNRKGGALWHLW